MPSTPNIMVRSNPGGAIRLVDEPMQLLMPISHLCAAPENRGRATEVIDVVHARLEYLPEGLDAMVVTSDLQGRELQSDAQPGRLLGEIVAQRVAESLQAYGLLRIGVLLCGDYYADPAAHRRGHSGDVSPVWMAFEERFAWVVGVAGNHDIFTARDRLRMQRPSGRAHLLDGRNVTIDGLKIGGISGITGSPEKLNRRSRDDYARLLENELKGAPDIVVIHESPPAPGARRGNTRIRDCIAQAALGSNVRGPLICCGHTWWDSPTMSIGESQLLNVDHRIVVLTAKPL